MLGLAVRTDVQARSKKGQPAQKTTGVASTRLLQLINVPYDIIRRPPVTMSAIAATKTGNPIAAAVHARRLMSASSGFA